MAIGIKVYLKRKGCDQCVSDAEILYGKPPTKAA